MKRKAAQTTADQLRGRYNWEKVVAPKTWRPKYNGEELVGFYGGRTTKHGVYGQYEVVIVHVPARGSFMISGTQLLQLVDSAMLEVGAPVRVVWGGYLVLGEERKMKTFDLFIVAGEAQRAEDLPEVSA